MNIVVYARDPLVFRDGRPFGEFGAVRSGTMRWPPPSAVAGMLRTRIGLNRDPDFFRQPGASDRIRRVRVECLQPVCRIDRGPWRRLYPKPADALVCDAADGRLSVSGFEYAASGENGIATPWKNWLAPLPSTGEKQAAHQPEFWNESKTMQWLTNPGAPAAPVSPDELGWPLPEQDRRIHCAIDADSGAAAEGQLWTSTGLCMQRYEPGTGLKQWGIAVRLDGCEPGDDAAGPVHLGGDRRLAFVEETDVGTPPMPEDFSDARHLRLLLVSPGNFGGWAPDWLLPESAYSMDETPWTEVPGTDRQVRLVSAFVPRWVPVSGWDCDKRRQKAMRKTVPAGAVYVVEVRDPSESKRIAARLWGAPLSPEDPDGGGVCLTGRANIDTQQTKGRES